MKTTNASDFRADLSNEPAHARRRPNVVGAGSRTAERIERTRARPRLTAAAAPAPKS
jgi:hypothetical protein